MITENDELAGLLEPVAELAQLAGEKILAVYNSDEFSVEEKSDKSPLTAADLASHHAIVDGLTALTPDIPILSEESASLPFAEELVYAGDNSTASGEAAANALLDSDMPPTAIFAANDDMAAGVVRIANRRGIAIPEQLSIAGFDDNSMARQLTPTLTTVRQPLTQMAATAAEGVIGDPLAESIVVPGKLMIRESTGPAPARA